VWTAVAIALGYTLLLALTDGMGFTRDESFYFKAGADYAGWFSELWRNMAEGAWSRSFSQASIQSGAPGAAQDAVRAVVVGAA
jgi:hypothetical protein